MLDRTDQTSQTPRAAQAPRTKQAPRIAQVPRSPEAPRAAKAAPTADVARTSPASRPTPLDARQRETMIRNSAYFRAKRRGFTPGHELEDWLAAEREVDNALSGRNPFWSWLCKLSMSQLASGDFNWTE